MTRPVDPIDRLAAFNQQARAHGLMAGHDANATRDAEVHEDQLPVNPPAANAIRDPTSPEGGGAPATTPYTVTPPVSREGVSAGTTADDTLKGAERDG